MTIGPESGAAGPSRATALVLALIGLIAVSHAVIFIRWAGDAPALLIAAMRVAIGTAVFLPFAFRGGNAGSMPRARMLSVLSGIFLAVHFGAWIESVQRLTIAESAVLVSLSPVWLVILDVATGKGWPDRRTSAGVFLCLCGTVALGWDGLTSPTGEPLGLALAIVGGMAMAGYLAIGRQVRPVLPTAQYVSICYGTAAVLLGLAGIGAGVSFANIPAEAWWAMLALGLVSQVIGHTSYNFALIRLSPVFAAICLLGEPIFGTLLGLLYLGETVPQTTLLGGIPILIGIWLSLQGEISRPQRR